MKIRFYLFLGVLVSLFHYTDLSGQAAKPVSKSQEQPYLPKVFLIGEYEQSYENLLVQYDKLLMTVFNNDMNKAYDVWSSILVGMEDYAKQNNFELNGLKLWINIFLNPDGTIQHIVYYPKPNSKNMAFDQLTTFMYSFSKTFRLKDNLSTKCSHYGSAAFPTFIKRY